MKPRFSFSFRETRFFVSRNSTSPPLALSFFSKTHQSSLTLKGGSTSHLGLLPSGKKRKPPYSVLKPLRYKVGGPSEVFASSRAAFCGMRPHGHESLTGCRKAMKPIATAERRFLTKKISSAGNSNNKAVVLTP